MNIYTVIPARGGSKSLPKKNIRPLNGKPLVQYSIDYSLACPLVAHTVVSTDSTEIAAIARKGGAEVPFLRPSEYAQDHTQDYPVMRHALEALEVLNRERIDALILLRPTSPLRPPGLIEKGIALLECHSEATSVRSVASCEQHPYRMWKVEKDYMVGYETEAHEPYNIPRQQLPPVYFQTGDLEIVRRKTLLDGSVSGTRTLPLIIDLEDIVDIDQESDFHMAQQRLAVN